MPDFSFVLLFHSLPKAFNLKNSIFFPLLDLKVRLKQCFCGMKDFLEHWVPHELEKHGLDDLMVHHLMQIFPMSSLVGDKICSPLNGELNDNESIECSVYAS